MTMQISHVTVDNFKRIKGVDVEITGNVITIGGRNAQGKSSFIDAIWNTLGGKQRAVTRPVRDGETHGEAEITIEDAEGNGLVVKRTWKVGKASQLTVRPIGSKAKISEAQGTLDRLIGAFAFDPLEFANLEKTKARDVLIDLIGVDLSELDAEYDEAYQARLEQGREVKRIQGSLESLERPAAGLPDDYVSVAALVKEREETGRVSNLTDGARERMSIIAATIRELQEESGQLAEKVQKGSAWLSSRRDLQTIEQEMVDAETTNASIRDAERYRETREELKAAESEHGQLDIRVKEAQQAKAAALASAQLPIEGLSFDESGVLYNGVPFEQASAAERIRVSVAIATAMNPELKVICVKDGSLLDEQSRADLIRLAEEFGVQLFLELVGNTGAETLVFEDGVIAS
jgi:predicted ATP-binding protein involved in virulence